MANSFGTDILIQASGPFGLINNLDE